MADRGFETMDEDTRRELASEGGRTSHVNSKDNHGRHRFDSEEAREAGRKGGEHSRNR